MTLTPRLLQPFTRIYKANPDVFCGPDTKNLRAGQRYDDWMPNDHTFIQGPDGRWHSFGITCPASPAVHDGEFSGYHICGPETISLDAADWTEHPKILPPSERPGEPIWFWAPYVIEHGGLYHMFYGPGDMRMAVSRDMFHWTPRGTIFSQGGVPRDPCIQMVDGHYAMVYVADNSLWLRWSDDLLEWDETPVEIFQTEGEAAPESPFFIPRDGTFYLFWCIYDGSRGPYDNRTFVLRSDDLMNFRDAEKITEFNAHAPEIIHEKSTGKWYISSAEWPERGISLTEMVWE